MRTQDELEALTKRELIELAAEEFQVNIRVWNTHAAIVRSILTLQADAAGPELTAEEAVAPEPDVEEGPKPVPPGMLRITITESPFGDVTPVHANGTFYELRTGVPELIPAQARPALRRTRATFTQE